MADNKLSPGPVCGNQNFKEAVCINANKIYDSCKDKDCLEDLRVYLTRCGQALVDKAINIRCKSAEVIWVYIDVEPVPFNKGFYTVDIKFFFRVTFDCFIGVTKPQEVEGLCTYDKKVILFGSEGNAKIYSSKFRPGNDPQLMFKTNMPKASVEVVDPIALGTKVVEPCENFCGCCNIDIASVPDYICNCFDDQLVDGNDHKHLFVTLGLFSIIRIERGVQLLIPAYDFCIPEKECLGSNEDDPCKLFRKIKFPTDEFFPPQFCDYPGAKDAFLDNKGDCGCK